MHNNVLENVTQNNFALRCGHIYHCSGKFCRRNPVISIGICAVWNFVWGRNIYSCRYCIAL